MQKEANNCSVALSGRICYAMLGADSAGPSARGINPCFPLRTHGPPLRSWCFPLRTHGPPLRSWCSTGAAWALPGAWGLWQLDHDGSLIRRFRWIEAPKRGTRTRKDTCCQFWRLNSEQLSTRGICQLVQKASPLFLMYEYERKTWLCQRQT